MGAGLWFLLIIPLLFFSLSPAHATTGSLQTATTQGLGTEFSVAVVIDSVTSLYGMATDLIYDPEYLEAVDQDGNSANGIQPKVMEGSFLNNNGTDSTLLLSALLDDAPGTLVLGATRSGNVSGVSTTTNKTILSVRFKTKKVGTTTIQFNRAGLKDPSYGTISVLAWNGVTINITEMIPAISVSCPSKDFGSVIVGNTSNRSCTVSNTGTGDLSVDSISITGSDASMFSQTNTCSTVSPGGSCEISLTFAPISVGPKSATLGIASNDPNNPTVEVTLTGIGVGLPDIAVSPSSLAFGSVTVGGFLTKSLTVSNNGLSTLVIASVTISGSDAAMFSQTNNCTAVVPAGSCTVNVTFTPTSQGAKTATLSISSNDPDTPNLNVALSGTGLVPDIALDTFALSFGTVPIGSLSSRTVTVSNTGDAPLMIASITISGTDAGMFSETNTCGAPVPPSGSCTITVTFTPTTVGAKAGSLAIVSNDPDEASLSVSLSGFGGSPRIEIATILLNEDFTDGIPANWPLAGAWSEGTTSSPCGGRTIGAPFVSSWVIVDSSCVSTSYEELFTQQFDAGPCGGLSLFFSNQYQHAPGSAAWVSVSDDEFVTSTDVLTLNVNDGYPTPNMKEVDLSSAAGSGEAQVQFAYEGDGNFWAIDNLQVVCRDPDEVRFVAPLGGGDSKTLVIRNSGESPLHIGSLTISGSHAGDFTKLSDSCSSQSVAPLGQCLVEVGFSPGGTGARFANLSIPSDDPDTPTWVLPLRGTGLFFRVMPSRGTIGNILEITGSGFGTTKGKVTIGNSSVTISTKVLLWTDETILVSLSKFLPTDTPYQVTVIPKVPKGTPPIVHSNAFEFRTPQIVWMSADHGSLGDVITLRGWYFGTKKGKVYIGTKSSKVLSWTMDPVTNYGEIVFVVPKGPVSGTYDLTVVNKVGTGRTTFTID